MFLYLKNINVILSNTNSYTYTGDNMKKILKIILPLLISVVFIMFGKVQYNELINPKFSPPSFVFSIVWSIIYLIFLITLFKEYKDKRIYSLYVIILSMHTIWNFLFFFMGYYLLSVIVIILIYFVSWIFVFYLSLKSKKYFYIYIIYIIWLMIATYLNLSILLLN